MNDTIVCFPPAQVPLKLEITLTATSLVMPILFTKSMKFYLVLDIRPHQAQIGQVFPIVSLIMVKYSRKIKVESQW
jgi:hypothetical protein